MRPIPSTLLALALGACLADPGGIHARMGWSEGGLRVVEVPPNSPAAHAGLQEDDRVVMIDGTPVSALTMQEAVDRLRGDVGSRCELRVLRDGEEHTLSIPRAPYERRR